MADYYDMNVTVIGVSKNNVENFVKLFGEDGYNGHSFYDCTVNYDAHPSGEVEVEETSDCFSAVFLVKCRNSAYANMMEGEGTSYSLYHEDPESFRENGLEPFTLEEASKELHVDVEIWVYHPDYDEEECYYEHYLCRDGELEIEEEMENFPLMFNYDPDEYEGVEDASYQQYETWAVAKAAFQYAVSEDEWNEAVESGEYTDWSIDLEDWEDAFWSVVREVSSLRTV